MLSVAVCTGRITADPACQYTSNRIPYVRFRLAVERDYKGKNGDKPDVDYISCIAWRQTAQFIAKHFLKGASMQIQGRLESQSWKDNNGQNRYSMEINVDHAWFGETKRAREDRENRMTAPEDDEYPILDADDSLPFLSD